MESSAAGRAGTGAGQGDVSMLSVRFYFRHLGANRPELSRVMRGEAFVAGPTYPAGC
jgi:hypothetical protein